MHAELKTSYFALYWAATTLVALGLAAFWFFSPFGFGFLEWPKSELGDFVFAVFKTLWYVGIPFLVVAQVASPFLWKSGKRRLAIAAPVVSLTIFGAGAAFVLSQIAL
jgi:hypothetical protein